MRYLLLLFLLISLQLPQSCALYSTDLLSGNFREHCSDCVLIDSSFQFGDELQCNKCGLNTPVKLNKPLECLHGINFENGTFICLGRETKKAYFIIPGSYNTGNNGKRVCNWCRIIGQDVRCLCPNKQQVQMWSTLRNATKCSYMENQNGKLVCKSGPSGSGKTIDWMSGEIYQADCKCLLSDEEGDELSCWCREEKSEDTNFLMMRNALSCPIGVTYKNGTLGCVPLSLDMIQGNFRENCSKCTLSKDWDELSCWCQKRGSSEYSVFSTLQSPFTCAGGANYDNGDLVCEPTPIHVKEMLDLPRGSYRTNCTKCTLNQEQDELKCLCQRKMIWNTRTWSTLLNPFDCTLGIDNEKGELICLTPYQSAVWREFQTLLRSTYNLVVNIFAVAFSLLYLVYALARSLLSFTVWILSKPIDFFLTILTFSAPFSPTGSFAFILLCLFLLWHLRLRVCIICKAEGEIYPYHLQSRGCECSVHHFYCRSHFRRMAAANLNEGKIRCMECGPRSTFVFSEKAIGEVAGADMLSNFVEAKIIRAREEGERRGREDTNTNAHPRGRLAEVRKQFEVIAIPKCPRCKVPIAHGSGCAAMKCDSCGCGFCMFCLTDCGDNAHSHVQSCSLKATTRYGSQEEINTAMKKRVRQNLLNYWNSLTDMELKRMVQDDPEIRAWMEEHQISDNDLSPC